jgi:AcrR family transcriptional regulator
MNHSRKRLPAGERRQQILEVATELFARQGFQGTTTKQIAQRAKVNEAILFRHFPSKKDLYWAVIEEKCKAMSGHRSVVEQLTAGKADWAAMATDVLERYSKDTTLMRLLLFSGLEAHELSERFFQTYIAGYYEELAKYLRQRIKAGEFRNVDPVLAARSFLGMVNHYLLVQELFGGKQHQKYDTRRVAETLTNIWLEGMKAT